MTNYARHFGTRQTPQSEPIPGSSQVQNSAGGYAYAINDWERLRRFLILGCDGGTYYASEKMLTKENAECVLRCMKEDGPGTVDVIYAVSTEGRAPKNDPALFALALAAGLGDDATKARAFEALREVARIPTHLFAFLDAVQGFRGWGRALRQAVAKWYDSKPIDDLAYQMLKYQKRGKWSHYDALNLAHPRKSDAAHGALYRWATTYRRGKPLDAETAALLPKIIVGWSEAQTAGVDRLCELILEHELTREMVPTPMLGNASVWEALLQTMPMAAMIRNLATMTKVGLLAPFSDAMRLVVQELGNLERLRAARIHPIQVLSALRTYAQGHGERGKQAWVPVPQIVDALDSAFTMSFGAIPATEKRLLLALDVSGSMASGRIAGVAGLTPREAAAAMAMAAARTCKETFVMGFSDTFMPLPITAKSTLSDAMKATADLPFAGTDCSLPMRWALQSMVPVDGFVVYTDNETWAGEVHPSQALRFYREKMGIPAKSVVVGLTATEFSIADPNDAGSMDVVGFDAAAPAVMSDFLS